MTVYVDEIVYWPQRVVGARSHHWSHLWADEIEELHDMAQRIGLKRSWFQDHPRHPHYDITPNKRLLALQQGAVYCPRWDPRPARVELP